MKDAIFQEFVTVQNVKTWLCEKKVLFLTPKCWTSNQIKTEVNWPSKARDFQTKFYGNRLKN
jgi:hypothetical protein